MLTVNSKIDLGKSFEELKSTLREVYEIAKSGKPGCHPRALGILESHVKAHLIKCTDADMKQLQDFIETPVSPDDIPADTFTQSGVNDTPDDAHKIAFAYATKIANDSWEIPRSTKWNHVYYNAYREKIKQLISDGSFS